MWLAVLVVSGSLFQLRLEFADAGRLGFRHRRGLSVAVAAPQADIVDLLDLHDLQVLHGGAPTLTWDSCNRSR